MDPVRAILTAKQDRFCAEYLLDLNATRAAARAGYSAKPAHVQGPRLLANVRVAARVAELQAKAAKRAEMPAGTLVGFRRAATWFPD